MPENPLRIAEIPPECLSVFSSRIAPKMIHRIEIVSIRPCSDEAMTRTNGICQAKTANSTVYRYTIGIAVRAASRRPINKIAASSNGVNARSDISVEVIDCNP